MPRSNALAKPLPSPDALDAKEAHASAEVRAFAAPRPRPAALSNDYLNHYSEALMLIEMAAADPELASELGDWRPLGYRAYFEASPLRRAPEALAAYEALTEHQRASFEALTQAMDALAATAIAGLQPPCGPVDAALIGEATLPPFHRLVARAASFLNSGGDNAGHCSEVEEAQAVIDRLIERAGAAE
jgi:hypothetical protein